MGGGAQPFLLGGLISLVTSVNERVSSLLNSVKYDSSWITSQRDTVSDVSSSASWQDRKLVQKQFFSADLSNLCSYSIRFL